MNEPTKLKLDPLEEVKTILEDAPRSYRARSEYVGDLPFVTGGFSELYGTLDAGYKLNKAMVA